ncbi:MAG: helix-turn-helix domain-containing protein [Acutalibacteraceae bacterium]|nr:helix-turn-helix domain-containing protein [Acutalibacteraceae bacterium]
MADNESIINRNNEMFADYDDIVSINDIMKMLHIGRSNVYKLLREKEIKCVRVGVKYIIPKKSVIEFLSKY